jgi:hypothetical protein
MAMAVLSLFWVEFVPAVAGQDAGAICPGGSKCEDARRAAAGPIPRTVDGTPNLAGRWLRSREEEGRATNIIEEHPAGYGIDAGKSLIIDPPDGIFPYQPWALQERNRRRRDENAYEDPQAKCVLSGVPRIMNFDFEILQWPDRVVVFYDYVHTTRIIPLDGQPHLSDRIRLYMGDPRGRWEGDTLVVDTTNVNGKTWMALGGDFMSADAHIVERFTMLDANRLRWEATVTDPKVFTRPWTVRYGPFTRDRRPGAEELEDACHEGNVDLVHIKNTYDASRAAVAAGTTGTRPARPPIVPRGSGTLTGRWVLSEAFDEGGARVGRPPFHSEIVMNHTSDQLEFEGISSRQDPVYAVFKLDGSEALVEGSPGVRETGRVSAEGETIVITSKRMFLSPAGEVMVDTRETYSLSSDTLTVERNQVVGGESTLGKAIYRKVR